MLVVGVDKKPGLTLVILFFRMMSSAALLGREESDSEADAPTVTDNLKPFEMAALKARAFRITKKERFDFADAAGAADG